MAIADARRKYLSRWGALTTERSSWLAHWREISEYLLPRSGRFVRGSVSGLVNQGDKRHNAIYDSTATRDLRILAAGMMAGMTSPARPWFRLATTDVDLMKRAPVKLWLDHVSTIMRDIFARSNNYRALHSLYEELGAFGTASSIVLPDFDDVIRHYPLTIGEYAISTDHRGEVTTLYRETQMKASQMVSDFGKENVSQAVLDAFSDGKGLDSYFQVVHVIEPRRDRDDRDPRAKNLPFASIYFEPATTEDKFLRESGFKRFPALCPRWAASGGDIYGNSPGMEALGDIKQLQHQQLRKAQAIDYQTKPPLQAPTSMKGNSVSSLPGGVTFVDSIGGQNGLRPSFEATLNLDHLLQDIQDVRQRIGGVFYADLFLMLANDQRSNITAREIAERHEEKLLMLGPVLERLHNELLKPLIDITFDRMMEAGIVPPAPMELHGQDLNVEFVSMLAQAQRAVGVNAVDRLLGTVQAVAAVKPEVIDKIDTDELVDSYADMLGVDPALIVAGEKVALIRQDRAKQAEAQQRTAMIPHAAQAAKTLSETDTQGKNGLTDVMQQFSGYATA
jgi:hypothetical protein